MNYIFNSIDKKINFLKFNNQNEPLKIHFQAKFELTLLYILGYLWNKNLNIVSLNEKERVLNSILLPSIGTIVDIIRVLDIENEFFNNKKQKKFYQVLDKYPNFRNEKFGHGYSYQDDTESVLEFYEDFFNIFETIDVHPIFKNVSIIKVTNFSNNQYSGIRYSSDGSDYKGWMCPSATSNFNVGDIYIQLESLEYYRISPFLLIEEIEDFYIFCSIEEKLTGRTKYNKINSTGKYIVDVNEFEKLIITKDSYKIKVANGTITNIYEKNYKKYIDVGITSRVLTFLKNSKAFVFATIWGHGGVGKTASIQRVCEQLCQDNNKKFDYVIFLSAKDRYYDYYKGQILSIPERIETLQDILKSINQLVFDNSNQNEEEIINFEGKLFLVIDDFETFNKQEKSKILEFIKKLDVNHHKVVLTTRAVNLISGEEIQTKELDRSETKTFLVESIKNEFPNYNIKQLEKELNDEQLNKIYDITSGRPLFILQLGILIVQKGTISDAIKTNIKSTKEAINFLYDRIYEYFSLDAKNMFLAISLITEENDLTGLLSHLRFILNKEEKEDEFQSSLSELIKLKVISLEDKDFFKVYSNEIFKLMKEYYNNKGAEYDGNITNRFNLINTDDNFSTEEALLASADSAKLFETEIEVENRYRYILNRDKSPYSIKLKALLNFSKYLITIKGNYFKAIKLFENYIHVFNNDVAYITSFSPTCWAEGSIENRKKSISILQDFLASRPKKLATEKYLEIIGMLLTYKSILVVNERDELKGRLRRGEINKVEHDKFYKAQKEELDSIKKYPGNKFWNLVKHLNLMELSPVCRNQTIDGLTHLVELCIRVNEHQLGLEMCHKIINEMPNNYHNPFLFKLQKIQNILTSVSHNKKNTTEFGDMLKSKLDSK